MGIQSEKNDAIPEWLDRSLVAAAWKNGFPQVDADTVEILEASKVGGGLLSDTFRVAAADGSGAEVSFIIKSAPMVEGPLQEFIKSGIFHTEKTAYGITLPNLEESLKKVGSDSTWEIAPKFYYKGESPVDFLVLEDLVASGFSSYENRKPLDLAHSLVVVRKIAHMHAASVPLVDDEIYQKKTFRQNLIFNENLRDSMNDEWNEMIKMAADILDDSPWFRPYKRKYLAVCPKLMGKAVTEISEQSSAVKVILHGDCHCGNMMFRGSGEETEVRFYDFQGLHVGSPAEDLQYFFHMSLNLDVLRDNVDQLLAEYHRTFSSALRALGLEDIADRYSLDQLKQDTDQLQAIGAYCTYFLIPFVHNIAERNFDIDAVRSDMKETEDKFKFMENCYRNKEVLKHLETMTPVFDRKGLFDS